jgi:hypothetical protein
MWLDEAEPTPFRSVVHRLVNPTNFNASLSELVEPDDIGALLAFVGTQTDNAEKAIRASFAPSLGYETPYPKRRFGDGTYPVLYTALELETAAAEVMHWARPSSWIFYCHCEMQYSGMTFDLVGLEVHYPGLISDDYRYCWMIGSLARERADACRVVSARKSGGINLPIFTEHTVRDVLLHGLLKLAGTVENISIERFPP